MTEEELKRIRCNVTKEHLWALVVDRTTALALLDEIDFLRQLVHDLKEESTAYKHGVEDGIKAERELRLKMMEDHTKEVLHLHELIDWIA